MPRRPVVDQEEVIQAADKLAADGKTVTALALLEALGGGSLTTVYKHLAVWEARRPATPKTNGGGEIPDVVQNAFANTWRVAAMEAAREVAAAKEKAAEEVRAAQQQFQDAMKAIELLEKEGEDDATKISVLENKVSEQESNLQKVSNDNAALNATLEQLQHQLKSHEVEAARLHNEIQGERDRHQEIIKEKEATIREAATLQGQVQALKEQNSELLSTLSDRKDKRS